MTIVEAIQQVLQARGHAMSAGEICDAIQSGQLYSFRAAHPAHVVQTQLRRHCEDSPAPIRAKRVLFARSPNNKFVLLRRNNA